MAEGGYYNMKYYSGDRANKIEEEVRGSLFRLPNEEEIENEMKEVENMKKLDAEYQQKKQEFERQKAKINVSKLEKIDGEQKRLAQRLEELVNLPKENDQEEIYKLIALKRKIAESQEQEKKILGEQFLISREKEIEEKVRKKIELERILEDKKQLNSRFSKLKMEMDMIKAEEDDRVKDTKKYLDKALQRNLSNPLHSDAIQKGLERAGIQGKSDAYVSEEDKVLLSKALVDGEVQDQKEKELVLKEIQARREQEKRKVQLEIQEKQRSLNDQRFDLMEEGEKLLKKKVQHYELQKKGVEFLASVEQGLAPPMEFILMNMKDVDEDQYRSENTIEDIVTRAKKFSRIGPSRINFMKGELKDYYGYDPYDKPYTGDLKPMIQRMNPENVYISRMIIDWLIELTIRKHFENENELAATREKQHYLQEKAKRLQKKVDSMTNAQCYVEMRDKILYNVIDKLIKEAAFEIATVNQMAKTISLNLIVRAIKGGRNSTNSEVQLSKIFYSLRNSDMTKKNDANFRFNYKDMAKLEDPKKKKDQKKKKDDQVEDDKDEDVDDQTVLQMYPETECVEMLGTKDILKLEIDYWNKIALNETPYLQHNPKKKYGVTAMALSFNKELLAIGFANGSVQIYSTIQFPALQIAQIEEVLPKRIIHMEFAFDNMSQLIVIDEDGNFALNFNGQNLKSKESKSSLADQVLVMKKYYGFNWRMLTRSGKVNTQEANKIVYATFHPGITFTGLQPYVMFGADQGLVMKFNSNKDLYKGIMYKFPIHNVINSPIITNQETEFPNEFNKVLEVTDNHNENSTKHINIFREFFVEHKTRVLLILFLNKPETFISFDSKGYIYYWVYEKDQYLVKLDGYQPKTKFKVSCQVMTYTPKTGINEYGESNSLKIDLNEGGLSKDEGGKKYFKQLISENKDYEKDLVNLKYNQSDNLKHIAEIIITKEEFPTESQQEVAFYKGRVNYREEKFESLSQDVHISQLIEGQVVKCQAISGNKYVIVQQILPHKVDMDRAYVQFVRFDTSLFRLKKVKIRLESPDVEDIDFSVVEDFGPFGTPYLFILMRQGLYVASLATGSILLDFKRHLNIIQAETKLSTEAAAHNIKHVLDLFIVITSYDSNGAYVFLIKDQNEDDSKKGILLNQVEYKRLFAI